MTADDLLLPAFRADPYPLYAALRAEGPVVRSAGLDAWVVTRYGAVVAALKDPRVSSKRGGAFSGEAPAAMGAALGPFRASLKLWLLFRDPPDHTRLRALASKAFTPALVEQMRSRIAGVVEELLAPILLDGRLDLVRDLAQPLPAIVIAEILGVHPEDRRTFKRWSEDLASFLAPGSKTREHVERALESWQEMMAYLRGIVAERRRAPREDLLSHMRIAEDSGSLLSEEELLATAALLVFAGHETTTNLICNGVLALLDHPAALAALREDPARIVPAVEEMLRYDSPVQLVTRMVKEDFCLAGQTVRKGEQLVLLLAGANRDPEQFPDADAFQIDRRDNRHLAFGQGIHFCIGAALARLEAQETIGVILRRLPCLRRGAEALTWQDNLAFRCPRRLILEV